MGNDKISIDKLEASCPLTKTSGIAVLDTVTQVVRRGLSQRD